MNSDEKRIHSGAAPHIYRFHFGWSPRGRANRFNLADRPCRNIAGPTALQPATRPLAPPRGLAAPGRTTLHRCRSVIAAADHPTESKS